MRAEEVEELLKDYGRHLATEDRRWYGGENCPQAWRFIDARSNPWTVEERTHFATGCPFCAKTAETLRRLEREELMTTATEVATPTTATSIGFATTFPGLSFLADRMGEAMAQIKPLGFIDQIRRLNWSASAISFFPLATATGIAMPGHFGPRAEPSICASESAANRVEGFARETNDPKTSEILLALAADLREPGSGIARLKNLPGGATTPEAALLLAIFYRRLGSQELAEAELKKVVGILRKEA